MLLIMVSLGDSGGTRGQARFSWRRADAAPKAWRLSRVSSCCCSRRPVEVSTRVRLEIPPTGFSPFRQCLAPKARNRRNHPATNR